MTRHQAIKHRAACLLGLLIMLMGSLTAVAQNRLYVTDFTAAAGKEAIVPIYLENSSDVVGMQFDITLPYAKSGSSATLVDARTSGHSISLRKLADKRYTVVVMSLENKALRGNAGLLVRFPVSVPATAQADDEVAFSISNVVLTDKTGHNVATETTSEASFTVLRTPTPDFTVTDLLIYNSSETLMPGGKLQLSFTVNNEGTGASTDGWTEKIYLEDQLSGLRTYVTTQNYANTLEAGESMPRLFEVDLPQAMKMEGTVRAYVEVTARKSTDELIADQGNNNATSTNTKELGKRLFLSDSRIELNEGNSRYVTVTRSGDWSMDETFSLAITGQHDETRISFPATVTIRAKQTSATFSVRSIDDKKVNTQYRTVLTAQGNDYEAVSMNVDVKDNDHYELALTTDKDTYTEGEEVTLTATIGQTQASDLTVNLTNTAGGSFSPFVRSIIIPAGQLQATATTQVVDDNYPMSDKSVTFTATASGYYSATRTITLQDDDRPQLSLTLQNTIVSEGAGYGATMATLTRTGNTAANVTIYLTTNAGLELYFDSQYVIIPAGQTSVTFPISVEDNSKIDSHRTWTITATACNAQTGKPFGQSTGAWTTAQLTVTDDDTDAVLKLSSRVATLEENGNAATVTIERNTKAGDLTVTLASDADFLELPQSVTIKNGQTSATFTVKAGAGIESTENYFARVTASAENFQSAQFVFLVSTKPNATCSAPRLSKNNPFGGESITVTLPVSNIGTSELPAGMEVRMYLSTNRTYSPERSSEAELLRTTLPRSVQAGETEEMDFTVTMPMYYAEKQYYIFAWLNPAQKSTESNFGNNLCTGTAVNIKPAFKLASISTDRTNYTRGNTIHFTGTMSNSASGVSMEGKQVDVFLLNDTKRYQVTTTLDAAGNFEADYTFGEQTGGRYLTGACVHGTGGTETLGHINVTRLKIERSSYLMENITEGVPREGNIGVTNLSEEPLYNVSFRMDGLPDDWEVQLSSVAVLKGGATANAHYRIVPTAPRNGVKTRYDGTFVVSANDADGEAIAESEMPVYFWNYPAVSKLAANDIKTTLYRDGQRTLQLRVENGGLKATGNISVVWPSGQSWLSAATTQLASIPAGGSTTLALNLKGQADMIVDGTYEATIRLKPKTGEKLDVKVTATVVSTNIGTLKVDVVDAYTLGAEDGEGPHVSGASVRLTNAMTGEVTMTGTTGSDGLFTTDILKEGTYYVYVTAPNHYYAEKTITIDPGVVNQMEVFLNYEVVKMTYTVERTTVVDEYQTVVTMDIVPDIPQAIVVASLPEDWGTGEHSYSVRLTNKGRLTAYTPYLEFPNVEGVTFTVVSDYPAVIYPNESFDVTVDFKGPEGAEHTQLGYIVMHYAYKLKGETHWGADTYLASMGRGELLFLPGGGLGSVTGDTEDRNFGTYTPPSGGSDDGGFAIMDGGDLKLVEPEVLTRDYTQSIDNRVRLQFEQNFFLEREAFQGNLKVENLQMDGIEAITLTPNVKTISGEDVSALFAISTVGSSQNWTSKESGEWSLASSQTGEAKVIYVPSKETAPTEPVSYLFGGTVSYRDIASGNLITQELTPTQLTVNPSPDLHLTYFVQRDFISDDPLTEDIEPWEPAQFALLIQNKGAGDAIDLKIETEDPQIVDNACNLPVEFIKLYATIDGEQQNMDFNKLNLGGIAAGQSKMARWWFYSNASAHVANFEARMTKHSNYGIEFDLITLDGVHELTRSVSGSLTSSENGAQARRMAFSPSESSTDIYLLNLIEDEDNLPDHVMDGNGNETDDLEIVSDNMTCIAASGENQYTLSVSASREGWVYGVMHDPTNCTMNLVRVVRNSDGSDVTTNIWQTDRTVTADYATIVDNRLHLADNIGTEESYTLYYEPKPAPAPKVKSIELVVEEGSSEAKATQALVTFEEAIDTESVDASDMVLSIGEKEQTVTVSVKNSTQVLVNWSSSALTNNSCMLTVYTADIQNTEGTKGSTCRSLTWTAEADVLPGDVNGDGVVNVTDIMALSSHIMGSSPANFVPANADVNGNGSINVNDIMGTAKIIMNK